MLFQHGGERGFFDIHDSCTVGRVKMTIFIRSSLKKRHCINVTRISDVNERHRDALRRGMDD